MSEEHPLVVLQQLDTRLDQIRHARGHLPEQAAVDEATVALRRARVAEQEATDARHAVQREERRLEDEVGALDAKIAREEGRLFDGSVTAARELQALQDEIASLKRRRSEIEDELLVQMEAAEPLDATLDAATATAESAAGALAAATAAADAAAAALVEQENLVRPERDDAAAAVDAADLEVYDQLRSRRGGVVVGVLDGRRCSACHIELPPVEVDAIKDHPIGSLVPCPCTDAVIVR